MKTLTLPLKAKYFNQIQDGTKTVEYRLTTDYWKKRLIGKDYDQITVTLGYPSKDDFTRRITRPYNGYTIETITHEEFGNEPVEVFAIPFVDGELCHDCKTIDCYGRCTDESYCDTCGEEVEPFCRCDIYRDLASPGSTFIFEAGY